MYGQRNDNLNMLDMLTIFSVILQMMGFQNDMGQSSNDDLMRELQRQDREFLDKIIENQKEILSLLSDLKSDTRL